MSQVRHTETTRHTERPALPSPTQTSRTPIGDLPPEWLIDAFIRFSQLYGGTFRTKEDVLSTAAAWWYYLQDCKWLTEGIWLDAEKRTVKAHTGNGSAGFLFSVGDLLQHAREVRKEMRLSATADVTIHVTKAAIENRKTDVERLVKALSATPNA